MEHGAGPASLSFPTGRPGAASLRAPLALGRRSGVSAKTSREEKASFRLAARLLAPCVDSSTRRNRERTAPQVKQRTAPALHLSRTPHNRISPIAQHQQHHHQQHQQKHTVGACLCLASPCLPARSQTRAALPPALIAGRLSHIASHIDRYRRA